MDPYIEACGLWEDFHHALISRTSDHLNQLVPDHYLVRMGERGYVVLSDKEFREGFIEIREAEGEGRLVTCIEVLSPSNKKRNSPGWELYLRKRQGLLLGRSAHLVEIDLLRGGERMPMADAWPESPYTLLVARTSNMPSCRVWSACYDCPLPPVPIPLLKPDPDVPLDLQPMIDAIYERSRYHRSIDYSKPLRPPLSAEETAWLEQRLKQRA